MDLKQNNLTKRAMKVSAGALATLSILSNSAFALSPRDIVKKAKDVAVPTVVSAATTAATASVIGLTGVLIWKLPSLMGEKAKVISDKDISNIISKINLASKENMITSLNNVKECLGLKDEDLLRKDESLFYKYVGRIRICVKETEYESKFEGNKGYKNCFLNGIRFMLGTKYFPNSKHLSDDDRECISIIINEIENAIEHGGIEVPKKQSKDQKTPGSSPSEQKSKQNEKSTSTKVEAETIESNASEEAQVTENESKEEVKENEAEVKDEPEKPAESAAPAVGSEGKEKTEDKKVEESSVEISEVTENKAELKDNSEEPAPVEAGSEVEEPKKLTEEEKKTEAEQKEKMDAAANKNLVNLSDEIKKRKLVLGEGAAEYVSNSIDKLLEIIVGDNIEDFKETSDLVRKLLDTKTNNSIEFMFDRIHIMYSLSMNDKMGKIDKGFYGSLNDSLKDNVYDVIKNMYSFTKKYYSNLDKKDVKSKNDQIVKLEDELRKMEEQKRKEEKKKKNYHLKRIAWMI